MTKYQDTFNEPLNSPASMSDPVEIARTRDQAALDLILRALELARLEGKPVGTFIVVNLQTGEYVTADTFMDANTAFIDQFPGARGFAHCLGEPLYEPLGLFTQADS